MIYDILFFAAFSVWLWLRYLDHTISLKFYYYGLEESNRLMRDKYGFLSNSIKSLAPEIIVAGAFLAVHFLLTSEWSWVAPAAGSAVTAVILQKNRKAMDSQRRRQKNILRTLAAIPLDEVVYLSLSVTSRVDRHWFTLFPWLYEPAQDFITDLREIDRAARVLSRRLHEHAHLPESAWFPA
jgi:hypothetical protein